MDFINGATVGFIYGAWFGVIIMCLISANGKDE